MRALEPLRAAFAGVTMIDTDAFTKTRCRQEAQFRHDGKLVWRKHPTPPGAPIDALLQQNVAALHSHHIILARTHAEKLRSEEHTSELQSLMRISYAVFCLKKKK